MTNLVMTVSGNKDSTGNYQSQCPSPEGPFVLLDTVHHTMNQPLGHHSPLEDLTPWLPQPSPIKSRAKNQLPPTREPSNFRHSYPAA